MTDESMKSSPDDPTAAEKDLAKALKGVARPAASDEAKERARQTFLSGIKPDVDIRTFKGGTPGKEEHGGGRPRSGQLRWLIPALAAAAAILLLVIGRSPLDGWLISDVMNPSGIVLQGNAVPGEAIGAGEVVTGDSSEVQIDLGDNLRLRFVPGTRATLPAPPGRWTNRDPKLLMEIGEAFGASRGPLGYRLHLVSPEAEAIVTGTSFAIIRTEEATCFCLYHGTLAVRSVREGPLDFGEGSRVFIYRDGRPHKVEPISAREVMKLQMLESSMGQ